MKTLPQLSLDLLANPVLNRSEPYGAHRAAILSGPALATARNDMTAWDGYLPTPLTALPNLAAALGVDRIHYAFWPGKLQGARRRLCRRALADA